METNSPKKRAAPRYLSNLVTPRELPSIGSPHSAENMKYKFNVGLSPKFGVPRAIVTEVAEETVASITKTMPNSPRERLVKLNRLERKDRSPPNLKGFQINIGSSGRGLESRETNDSEEFRQRLVTPVKEEKVLSLDENPHKLAGGDVVNKFYFHYKKLDKIKDTNLFTQIQDATYTSFLNKSQDLKLLPSKIGFIKERGEAEKIKLNHYRLGDKYAEVLSEGIRSAKNFNSLELANNRITPSGANHILTKLNSNMEHLDLSGNNIGRIGCEHLCNIIGFKNSKLLELNLEGNKLGDQAIMQLCEAIAYNNSIRKLNFGKNLLSDTAGEKIGRMLELNSTLEEFYLRWNQIKSIGGSHIVDGLKSASKLKILDLSWNSLGLNGQHFIKSFGAYIATNTTLVHLDLSNNYITKGDAKLLADDLKHNHTLYGFHFYGNTGYVNHKGFLMVPDDCDAELTGRNIQQPIDGAKFIPESLKHYTGNHDEFKDVCWICEGWRPKEFAWTSESGSGGTEDPVYVHISHEGNKGVFLPAKNGFKLTRMVPPMKFTHFYTVDGLQTHAADQEAETPKQPQLKAYIDNEEKDFSLSLINYVERGVPGKIVDHDLDIAYELKELDIRPRVPDEVYIPASVIVERPKWKIPISVFRTFKPDTQQLVDDCFKVDFEGTRISKLVKSIEDLELVRQLLYNVYKQLKDCYKYYSAVGAPSEIWSIPLNTYTEFCQGCGIIDGKILKLSDFDRVFIATYTRPDKEKNHRNPDRALVRYQFMEGLVRIAEQKYLNQGTASTYADAMKLLMDESVRPFLMKFDHHQFRPQKYWNEEVDTVYKSYLPILRGLYKKYSGQRTLPGQKKFMCLDEFNRMMTEGSLYTENCGERESTVAFSLAIQSQVDELNSDRIYQMQFVEFLEALGRVADRIAAHPYGYIIINPQTGLPENEMPYDKRFALPLHVKLEGMMPALFNLCNNDVKEVWILPETSIFQLEEVNGKQRFPTKKKKIMRINPTDPNSIEPYDGINALQI